MLVLVATLVILLVIAAVLVTFGPIAACLLVPVYVVWRRSRPSGRKLRFF